MALFYRNLREKSGRRGGIAHNCDIHRNPSQIPELAKGWRGKFEVVPGTGGAGRPASRGGAASTLVGRLHSVGAVCSAQLEVEDPGLQFVRQQLVEHMRSQSP